jgi:hypothetical protein
MKGSLKEVINFSFNHRIAKKAACTGHFDETERERVLAGTTSNKIVIQDSGWFFLVELLD